MSQCTLTKFEDNDSGYGPSTRTSQQTDDCPFDLSQSCEDVAATFSGVTVCPETPLTTPSIATQSLPPSPSIALRSAQLRVISKCIDEQIQTRAEDVIERISGLLDEYMVKHKWKHISVAIRLAVLGTTEEDAKACLVVFCDDSKGVHARIRRFLRKTRAKELYRPNDMSLPRFDVLVAGPPTRNKGTVGVEVPRDYIVHSVRDTLCGMSIMFVPQPNHERTLATMGGILQLQFSSGEKQWYGLTAAHGAMNMNVDTPDDKDDIREDSSEDDVSDSSSSMSIQSSNSSHVSMPSMGFIDARCLDTTAIGAHHAFQSQAGQEAIDETFQLSTLYDIQDGQFRDWAIFPLPVERCSLKPNIYNNQAGTSLPLLLPNTLNRPSSNRQVIILTGSSGPKTATLAPCLSRIRLTPGSKFVRAYTVQLHDISDVKQGDSGSWVIDPVSLEVYGHLIATDSLMGSYVIPLVDICADIKNVFPGVSIDFPGTQSEAFVTSGNVISLPITEPGLLVEENLEPSSTAHTAEFLKGDHGNEENECDSPNRGQDVEESVTELQSIRNGNASVQRRIVGNFNSQPPPVLTATEIEDLEAPWNELRAAGRRPSTECHDEQYVPSLGSIREGFNQQRNNNGDQHETISPSLRALSLARGLSPDAHAHIGPWQRIQRSTLERKPEQPSIHSTSKSIAFSASFHDSGIDVDEDLSFVPLLSSPRREKPEPILEDITPRARGLLTQLRFTDDQFTQHRRDGEYFEPIARVLDEAIRRRPEKDLDEKFRDFASYDSNNMMNTTLGVYEVLQDASVVAKVNDNVYDHMNTKYDDNDASCQTLDENMDVLRMWDAIKNVNYDCNAVGRISIVQQPTPLILAALYLTMSPHFDMLEILNHLLSDGANQGYTSSFMHRAFEQTYSLSPKASSLRAYLTYDTRNLYSNFTRTMHPFTTTRQRSFFFVFKYYTCISEGLEPAPWQRFDNRSSDRPGDHIDIAECSSILALSFDGEPIKRLGKRSRRQGLTEGLLFDTFGPWHVLNIQSFPDNLHTIRGEEFQQKSFYNGPYAFLTLLVSEYNDAGKRNRTLNNKITKLITPPTEFMFDRKLRDKLLFEDKHFTYIRRYFWAYNTLAVINTGIKNMMSAYFDTFTDEFWSGSHPLLWPHPAPTSPEGLAYKDKMALLRTELEKAVTDLKEISKRNEDTRKEIENLRDQLFSGSSIKESRKSIESGDNIKILTMISVLFLPLTFVTSVFGMTNFTIPATDWRFAVTMATVSLPFLVVMVLVQTGIFIVVLRGVYDSTQRIVGFPYRVAMEALTLSGRLKTSGTHGAKKRDERIKTPFNDEKSVTSSRWKWPWDKRHVDKVVLGNV